MHDIKFTADGSKVWAATDGGPFVKDLEGSNLWENKVNNIGIAIIHYFDQSRIDPNYYLFGGFDVHSQLYDPYEEKWFDKSGGDGYGCGFDNEVLGIFYVTNGGAVTRYENWVDENTTSIGSFWDRHVVINPWNHKTLYMSLGDRIVRSTDKGDTWVTIADYDILSISSSESTFYDMHVAEGDGDYLYLRLTKEGDNGHSKIYKTTNVNEEDPADIDWEFIELGQGMELYNYTISDIEVDDLNPDRIWVTSSKWSGDNIFEYNDGNWIPLNNSNLLYWAGITNIEHIPGTEEALFVSTSHTGVFYLENYQAEWMDYCPYLPSTSISELKINQCSGKIVAGTYGRGLWETDLPSGLISNPVFEDGDIWEGYRYVFEDLTIPTGETLTIKGKVGFAEGVKLIVQRGAHLVIDNGKLTNSCGQSWHGIEVWGNSNELQLVTEQGWVEVINGGIIKNSVYGIYTNRTDPESEGGYIAGYTGGIIEAEDASFINNGTAIYFHSYPKKSVSLLKDCIFETNDEYMGDNYPEQFVKAVSMDEVTIINCDFINNVSIGNYQKGLYSLNAHIIVKGKCTSGSPCTDWDYGLFENLQYGIYATDAASNKFIDIEHTKFNNNFKGLYISGMSNARVVSNNFEVNTPYSPIGGYGMYLNNSTAYEVEENNFYHSSGTETGLGLIVNESGEASNRIYRNYFTGLECGMDIQGENRNLDGTGLQLRCNTYENTLMDKIITWDEQFLNGYAGISSSQGSPGFSPEDMAGNLFEVPGPANGDFDDILNEGNKVTYYYPFNNNDGDVIPVDFTQNTVFPEEIGGFIWSFDEGCPPTEPGGGGGGGTGLDGLLGDLAAAEEDIATTSGILVVLVDGGDTEALNTEVETSLPPETMQVYNELMESSPYLSDTVVGSAIEKENVLPNAMIRDIMVANPQTAKSDELMNKLDERWDPLPDYMKAQILQGRSIVSLKEELESQLAAHKQKKARAFNGIVRYFLIDTLNPAASSDSLVSLLEQDNLLSSKYSLAFLHLELGTGSLGQSVLNDIPQQFNLSDDEAAEHLQLVSYYDFLLSLALDGKDILEADSLQVNELLAMEASQQGMAAVYARNILLALNEIEYEEPILLPDMLKSSEAVDEYEELLSKTVEAPGYIKIQPNPATDYFIIEYDLEKEEGAVVDINSLTGNLMYSAKLMNKNDQIFIDTRNWKTGVYIATLKINTNFVESLKFTIVD